LHNAIVMVAHGQFWHIAHEIVQPVVNASQHVDWLAHVTAHTHTHTAILNDNSLAKSVILVTSVL